MSAKTTPTGQAVLRRVVPAALILLTAGLAVPVAVPQAALAASPGTVSISAAFGQSCAIENGKAYCWGGNQYGQLGDGSTTGSSVPVAVDTSGVLAGKTLTQITVSFAHTCALDSTGAAYCWGWNLTGQLGDGSTGGSSSVPVAVDTSGVLAGKTLTQITAGLYHTCVLDSTGAAYCWGANWYGELGRNNTNSGVPVAVDTSGVLAGKTLTQITAGNSDSTCALDSTGAAYCWGDNPYGELGDGSTTDSSVPVAVDTSGVLAGKTLTRITTGFYDTCAVDSTGAAYCWGFNNDGELGDGNTTDSSVPVAVDASGVLAGKALTQIAVSNHMCALDLAGAAYCWGYNGDGDLGDGNTTDSSVPVAVDASGVLAGKALTQIAVSNHTCALDLAGAVYCWGRNDSGELGDDSTTMSDVPVLTGPQAPTGVTAIPGSGTTARVSWTAPASLDGGTLTGYTASASPGDAACTIASGTTCTITGLANGSTYSITVVAHTTSGDSGASTPATVTLVGGPAFTSSSADTAAFGAAFTFTVTATGDPVPKITRTGRLPSGVTFTRNGDGTATISGTPATSAAGAYPLTLTARNKNGTATQAFTLTVTRAPAIKKIPTTRATVGEAVSLTVRATGYPLPLLAESGTLPSGLSFTDNGNGAAVIAGTPATGSGGRYPITITATNTSGTATRHFTVVVS
jgi:alpha-tubulin suppressor-like RCC1 family protein